MRRHDGIIPAARQHYAIYILNILHKIDFVSFYDDSETGTKARSFGHRASTVRMLLRTKYVVVVVVVVVMVVVLV